jgi:thiosulfate/3-mercaptopyruvate sulfurtransferase
MTELARHSNGTTASSRSNPGNHQATLRQAPGGDWARTAVVYGADQPLLPLLAEPDDLNLTLGHRDLLIVDLSPFDLYEELHIPGAVHLDRSVLVSGTAPAVGDLPEAEKLSAFLGAIGLQSHRHVIAYDDEGGSWASRLLWTLDVIGHSKYSLLDGGLSAWLASGHDISEDLHEPAATDYRAVIGGGGQVTLAGVLDAIDEPDVVILDARSAAEFRGEDLRAERGGHIPGAVNLNWSETMHRLRLKPAGQLEQQLLELGVTRDKEIIVYCQTHHRSAHTYIMLKTLGFEGVRAYAGSWAEWGNSAGTPVEV